IVNAIQYISPETAVKLGYSKPNMTAIKYDENADVNEVHNRITEIKTYEYTINAEHQKQALSDSCDAVNAVLYVFIILAFVLGIIIIYIMVVINIGEKKGEYSMLMALGIQTKRFIKIAAVENVIRYIFSVLIGVPLGLLIASFVLGGMSSVRTSYPFVNVASVCVLSCLFAMLYLIAGVFLTLYVIKRVDPAFTLNTRE
ncbi:MAG: ABC transporter permease, partial [Clostridiales bacterium]|nr:ABC transporter permease [Candidatus Coliplasma equi]